MEHVDKVRYKAFGKVNLALGIHGQREDGYHEVSIVMVPVDVFDMVTVQRIPTGLEVFCPDLPLLPQQDNIAYRAAQAILSRTRPGFGIRVTLEKSILPGSGMGGGSSDAAATLLAVNDLLDGSRRLSLGQILSIATGIGADVPFLVGCNQVLPAWEAGLCTGAGQAVAPLQSAAFWLVLVFFEQGVSTAWAYSEWDRHEASGGLPEGFARSAFDRRIIPVREALARGDPVMLARSMYNDLEYPVMAVRRDVGETKERLLAAGALGALMTGSGPTVFGVCRSRDHADKVRERFLVAAPWVPGTSVFVAKTEVSALEGDISY